MYVFINKEVVLQNSHLFPLHSSIYSVNLFLSFSALSMSFYIHYPCPSPLSLSFYKLFFSPPIPIFLYSCPSLLFTCPSILLYLPFFLYPCPFFWPTPISLSFLLPIPVLPSPYPCPGFSIKVGLA